MLNNLLSIGIVGLEAESGKIVFEFEANIKPLDNHVQDIQCMKSFWLKPKQQKAWNYLQTNQKPYTQIFEELSLALNNLALYYKIEFVAYPACFDWMFFKCYYELAKSTSTNKESFYDIGYECLCISTLWDNYKKSHNINSNEANKMFRDLGEFNENVNHYAIEDARVQGKFYYKLLNMI